MNRVLAGTSNTIFITFYVGETATDADAAVTVTVKNAAGTTISTGNANNEAGPGNYSYTVPVVANPTQLTVTWSGLFSTVAQTLTQDYEVVGKFLFALSELRAMDGLDDTVTFTTAKLAEVRDEVTDLFVNYMRTAYGETYMRETIDGNSLQPYFLLNWLPVRRILTASLSGVSQTITSWVVDESGYLTIPATGPATTGHANYVIEYVFGQEHVPGMVKRAALKCARAWLLQGDSSIPDRARMMTTEWGTFNLNIANEDYPTGMPEVDSVLNRYGYRLPGFA